MSEIRVHVQCDNFKTEWKCKIIPSHCHLETAVLQNWLMLMKCVLLIMDKIDCSSTDAWSLKDIKAPYNVFVRLRLGLCNPSLLRTNCSFPLGSCKVMWKEAVLVLLTKSKSASQLAVHTSFFVLRWDGQKWRCLIEEKLSLKLKGVCYGSQATSIHAESGQWSPRVWAETDSTNFFPG